MADTWTGGDSEHVLSDSETASGTVSQVVTDTVRTEGESGGGVPEREEYRQLSTDDTRFGEGPSEGLLGGLPFKRGALAGALAFVVGYVCTFVLYQLDDGFTIQEADDVGTFEMVGLVFYSGHFAEIRTTVEFDGQTESETFDLFSEASTDLPELVYHLVPVLLLVGAGYLIVNNVNVWEGTEAALSGATVVVGYLPLAVIGSFLFSTSVTDDAVGEMVDVSASPELVSSILLVGLLFPLLFGALGGFLSFFRNEN